MGRKWIENKYYLLCSRCVPAILELDQDTIPKQSKYLPFRLQLKHQQMVHSRSKTQISGSFPVTTCSFKRMPIQGCQGSRPIIAQKKTLQLLEQTMYSRENEKYLLFLDIERLLCSHQYKAF
jgi:hypothetical protein